MLEITKVQLLAEFEDLLRQMPARAAIHHDTPENRAWLGRASALVEMWNTSKAIAFDMNLNTFNTAAPAGTRDGALRNMLGVLNHAAYQLRLETIGPLTVAVGQGNVFDYFDEIRKIIEAAKTEIFFVDPYLDAEFVSKYLPQITSGVSVKLLGQRYMDKLIPAVEALKVQNGMKVEVRTAASIHDRYIFIDRQNCYQSGASFKDGAKNAPTTLTQITDAFSAVLVAYEQIWKSSTIKP